MNKRKEIWLRDGKKCSCCGAKLHIDKTKYDDINYCQLDHIIPKSLGGDNSKDNLRATCKRCNSKRQNKSGTKLIEIYKNKINKTNINKDLMYFEFDVEKNLLSVDDLLELKQCIKKIYRTNMATINYLLKTLEKGDD